MTEWIPIRLYWQRGQAMIDWCWFGKRRFTEPFFAGDVEQCLRLPFNLAFRRQTTLDVLLEWGLRQPGVQPAGFIFHMSRCGSTLVSQMLAQMPQHVVISEATPIETVLAAPWQVSGAGSQEVIVWLRGLLSAWGQRRTGVERYSFVKFDARHILELPLLHEAFPQTPWIFLYREPIEVLVSLMRERGSLHPGPITCAAFKLNLLESMQWPAEEFCARALAQVLQAALAHRAVGRGMFVNYRQLPGAVGTRIADHFDLDLTGAERDLMLDVATKDAKDPARQFAGDAEAKQRAATPRIRDLAEVWLRELYVTIDECAASGATA